jgi:DNA repair photolyase
LIVTKSPLVLRDLDILAKYPGRAVVQITVTTLDGAVAERLEPHAPRPSARLEAARRLAEAGVPVGVRLDPIVPYVNDSAESLSAVVDAAADAGARQLVASTYKAKPDNFARLVKAFPEVADMLRELYWVRGAYLHGQRYAPAEYRSGFWSSSSGWPRRGGYSSIYAGRSSSTSIPPALTATGAICSVGPRGPSRGAADPGPVYI